MSRYPAELDNDADLPPVANNITEIGAEAINALRASVFALEAALGRDPQGSLLNLSERLGRTLNDDGTWKAAALVSAGLVSLPIDNAQIGASAGIEESKLDLDFPTAGLSNDIISNNIDILALQISLAADINHLAQHIVGAWGRHDGYQTDISGLTAQPTILTVEDALGFIYDTFLRHRKEPTTIEHLGSAIGYTPVETSPITADNVQDAISQIDGAFVEEFRQHRDTGHSDGVSADGYVYLGGQAAVNDASLRLTRFISTVGANIMRVGLNNSAVILGNGFEPANISSTADAITVSAKTGSNSRSLTVTGLNSSSADYPSGASPRFKLKGIVNALNTAFGNASNNFPVSAYESDGELVLQHNIARADCTITVSAPANSALGALGLADMADIEVARVNNYVFIVNGKEFDELKVLKTGSVTHGGGATVDLVTTITDSNKYKFLHVFGHATASQNGTYKISSTGATTVSLVASVAAGTLNFIVYEDAFDLPSATNAVTMDFFIDEDRNLIAENRVEAGPGPTGIKVVEASRGLTGATASFKLSTSGVQLTVDGVLGTAAIFDNQFVGYLKVPAPDGLEYITVFLFNAAASNGTSVLTLTDSNFQDNRLHLGTGHFDLGSIIENPLDRRNVGLVGLESIGSEFKKDILERDLANFHISGIINGFSIPVTTFPTSSIQITGGSGYVNGKFIEKPRRTIVAGNRISAAATYNLLLSSDGSYEIFNNATAGYGVDDIIAGDNYTLLWQLVGSAGSITSVIDGRVFVNNLELKLPLTVDSRELGAGTFHTLEAAQLYSANAPNDTKPEISVFSDLSITSDLAILSNTVVRAIQDISTGNSGITISDNSILEVLGNLTSNGTITLSSGSSLILRGLNNSLTSATSIVLGDDTTLVIDGYVALKQITVTGSNVKIYSDRPTRGTISFTANSTGIDVSSGIDSLIISDVNLIMSKTGQNAILSCQAITSLNVSSSSFSLATPTISTTQATQSARAGIEFTTGATVGVRIRDCEFTNIAAGIISITPATLNKVMVSGCRFTDIGRAIELDNNSETILEGNSIERMHQFGILIATGATLTEDIVISNTTFRDLFVGGSRPVAISSVSSIFGVYITNNIFRDITAANIIDIGGGFTISNNEVHDCTVTAFVLDLAGTAQSPGTSVQEGLVSNNKLFGINGDILTSDNISFIGNMVEGITGGTSGIDITESGAAKAIIEGNTISLPTDVSISLVSSGRGFLINNNYIIADKINIDLATPTTGDIVIANNHMVLNNIATLSENGIDLTITNSGYNSSVIINGNYIEGSEGNTISIVPYDLASDGEPRVIISDNSIIGGTGSGVYVGDSTTGNQGAFYAISHNIIEGNGNYGIFMDGYSSSAIGNTIMGSVAIADILSGAGIGDIYIADNSSLSTGGGSGIMGSQDAIPYGVYVGPNKNVISTIAYDAMMGWAGIPAAWVVTSFKLESNTASTRHFYIPLTGLPIGGILDSVDVHCYPNAPAGAINIKLYERGSTSLTAINIGPAAGVDSTNNGTREVISISPYTTVASQVNEQIKANRLMFIDVTSTANQNQIAQVIANVKY